MMEKEIIEDLKKTIKRLQEECTEKTDMIITISEKLKQKEEEYLTLARLIRNTKQYTDACETCRDEILIYPSISGRTNYKQIEVEEITLLRIINQLKTAKEELDELHKKSNIYTCGCCGKKDNCNIMYSTLLDINDIAAEVGMIARDKYDDKTDRAMQQILEKIREVIPNDRR